MTFICKNIINFHDWYCEMLLNTKWLISTHVVIPTYLDIATISIFMPFLIPLTTAHHSQKNVIAAQKIKNALSSCFKDSKNWKQLITLLRILKIVVLYKENKYVLVLLVHLLKFWWKILILLNFYSWIIKYLRIIYINHQCFKINLSNM